MAATSLMSLDYYILPNQLVLLPSLWWQHIDIDDGNKNDKKHNHLRFWTERIGIPDITEASILEQQQLSIFLHWISHQNTLTPRQYTGRTQLAEYHDLTIEIFDRRASQYMATNYIKLLHVFIRSHVWLSSCISLELTSHVGVCSATFCWTRLLAMP